jgi:hypothetical protein
MENLSVTIKKISAKTGNQNFIHTLKTEGTTQTISINVDGVAKTITRVVGAKTYFLALPDAFPMGAKLDLNGGDWSVTERNIVLEGGEIALDERTKEPIMLKWLKYIGA